MKIDDWSYKEDYVNGCIKTCQEKGHIHQVAFSTYHHALTQICFTCNMVRTTLDPNILKECKKSQQLSNFALSVQGDKGDTK